MIKLISNEMKKFWKTKTKWLFLVCLLFPIFMTFFFDFVIGYKSRNVMEFMMNVEMFRLIITIFALGLAATIFANEYSKGTIKFLLIRPVSRTKIFIAKWLTVVSLSLLLLLAIVVTSLILGILFYGIGGSSQEIQELAWNYCSEIARFTAMASFAMLVSIFFRNGVLALGLSFAITFGFIVLIMFLQVAKANWAKFLLFANLDFNQYFYGNQPPFTGMNILFSLAVILIHIVGFTLVAWFIFKEKDIIS